VSAARLALFGHPVAHSLSAVMFEAAFRRSGRVASYELVDVPDGFALAREVERVRSGDWLGANVTLPHKRAAIELADVATDEAREVGASNLLYRDREGRVCADNTDVGALSAEIEPLVSRRCTALVLGAGGAARAAVVAARRAGFRSVWQVVRRFEPASDGATQRSSLEPDRRFAWPAPGEQGWLAEPASIDLVLQATSVGMLGADDGLQLVSMLPLGRLAEGAVVYDLVYRPEATALVLAARARGLEARSGLGMLVRQAEAGYARFFGEAPPSGVMERAAREALEPRAPGL
jgi:shikimate dehydrogenase